jgi:hypothetical protein
MAVTEDEERQLRMELMRADIENKRADTEYKRGLLNYEPWKLILAAFGAGAALMAALTAVVTLLVVYLK